MYIDDTGTGTGILIALGGVRSLAVLFLIIGFWSFLHSLESICFLILQSFSDRSSSLLQCFF
jgi:hypothetical protein